MKRGVLFKESSENNFWKVVLTAWPWQKDIDNEKRTPNVIVKMKGKVTHRSFRTKSAESDLRSLGLKEDNVILDFGCGTGIYTIAAARVVGEKGTVHAVDLHPEILSMIEKRAASLGLKNIDTIYSDLETGVDEESVDAVLFYDVLKGKKMVRDLLSEAYRVVKEDGSLFVRQPGIKEDRVKDMVIKDGLFSYMGKHGKTLKFRKIEGEFHEVS